MHRTLLLTTTGLLAACALDPPPAPAVSYTPAVQTLPPPMQPALEPVALAPPPATSQSPFKTARAALAAAMKGCRRTALNARFEGSIATYEYQRGACYELVLGAPSAEGEPDSDATLLFLAPEDGDPNAGFSDETFFTVEKTSGGTAELTLRQKRDRARAITAGTLQNILPVKCWKPGAKTTMFVSTSQRTYQFQVNCNSRQGAAYNPAVQFTYPSREPPPAAPRPVTVPIPIKGPFDFAGPAELLPGQWMAYHDGARTHIKPPPQVQTRPTPFRPGMEQAPPFRIDPTTTEYVIQGTYPELEFRFGNQTLTVRRVS